MDLNYKIMVEKANKKLKEISNDCPKNVIEYYYNTKKEKTELEKRKENINLISLMERENPCEALRMHNVYLDRFKKKNL